MEYLQAAVLIIISDYQMFKVQLEIHPQVSITKTKWISQYLAFLNMYLEEASAWEEGLERTHIWVCTSQIVKENKVKAVLDLAIQD